jgi:hypothetical protein
MGRERESEKGKLRNINPIHNSQWHKSHNIQQMHKIPGLPNDRGFHIDPISWHGEWSEQRNGEKIVDGVERRAGHKIYALDKNKICKEAGSCTFPSILITALSIGREWALGRWVPFCQCYSGMEIYRDPGTGPGSEHRDPGQTGIANGNS